MSDDLVRRLRAHVEDRGGPSGNGAWQMMLDAADRIETLERRAADPLNRPPVRFPRKQKVV